MRIPRSGLEKFVREVVDQCMITQTKRVNQGAAFKNYFLYGADGAENAAMYNKTFAYLDDLESLLYSPVSLRFHIGNPDFPNVLDEAKGRAAAAKLRGLARKSDTDTHISAAVLWSLVKGKSFIKQNFKRGGFTPELIQPESMGVLRENHGRLDEDMEAFTHSMYITSYQLERMVWNHPDKETILRRAKRNMRMDNGGLSPADGAMKQVIVGGLYPFQAADSGSPNRTRGIVDWMGGPAATLAPGVMQSLVRLDEAWIWDDARRDWTTFQIVGDDILIMGKYVMYNALSWNTEAMAEAPELKGRHPFVEFCPNPIDGYFWGRSEITNVALLQEGINSRINGTNRLLRRQEDPPKKFVGASGVNQNALARFNKPGGYWSDTNPNAKIDEMAPTIPTDLWASLHEFERMFDEMGGLPPIARGRGEAGVRSQGHAETLVRMFSPRFKDRALLIERDVESLGALMLDLARVHIDTKLTAWAPADAAGLEAAKPNPLITPPAPGMMAVNFMFADLDDNVTLTVDSHSSSPAFSAEAKSLIFDLFKIGGASATDVVEAVDVTDPEQLVAGIERREVAKAEQARQEQALKLVHGKGK